MNKYENLCCPVCHAKLFEDDDIVVCPVCGAPHHRACYQLEGHCHFEQQHGTPQQWKPPEPEKEEQQQNQQVRPCPNCGTPISDNMLICPNCKMPLTGGQPGNTPFGQPFASPFQTPPYAPPYTMPQVDRNEELDGVTAGEIMDFVVMNPFRYLRVFRKQIQQHTKVGWNWLAFLLPECWLLARKCYKSGTLVVLFKALVASLTYLLGLTSDLLSGSLYGDPSAMAGFVSSGNFIVLMVLGLLSLLVNVLFGMFGDTLYRRYVYKKIHALKAAGTTGRQELSAAGGVNMFAPVIGYMAESILAMIIPYIVSLL